MDLITFQFIFLFLIHIYVNNVNFNHFHGKPNKIKYANLQTKNWVLVAEVEPISTYVDFGEKEFLVADERGYEHLLYKMAESFLFTSDGEISDSRLKLNKVRRKTPINLSFMF